MKDLRIDDMLKNLGIKDIQTARNVLFDNGLIQKDPNRPNIASNKVDRARAILEELCLWYCNRGDCSREASRAGDLQPLQVEQRACRICGGKPTKKALREMARASEDAGLNRILVVGGTERKEREIKQKSPESIKWRFIDGKKAKGDRYYRDHREWADIIVIWQSTPLDHGVSSHFDGKGVSRVITVPLRGISCLADEIVNHCRRG